MRSFREKILAMVLVFALLFSMLIISGAGIDEETFEETEGQVVEEVFEKEVEDIEEDEEVEDIEDIEEDFDEEFEEIEEELPEEAEVVEEVEEVEEVDEVEETIIKTMSTTEDVVVDGINYTIDSETGTATMYLYSMAASYTSSTCLPSSVSYNDTSYAITSVVLGADITSVPSYAFYYNSNLQTVVCEGAITSVGEGAFYGCTSLYDVGTLFDTVVTIGNSGFRYSGFTSIEIGDQLTSVGTYAFASCSKLVDFKVGSGLTTLGTYMFCYCYDLQSASFAGDITSFGSKYLFYSCSDLEYLAFTGTIDEIEYTIFQYGGSSYCPNIVTIVLGNIDTIDTKAFYGLTKLETVTCESLNEIGSYAFYNCSSLSNESAQAVINQATSIGTYAFYGCIQLTSIVIPETVTSVSTGSLFQNCTNLKSITLPSCVTTLAYGAFYGCTNLVEVIALGEITTLYGSVFRDCTSLENIDSVTKTVTSASPSYVFYGCTSLVEVTFSDELTVIQTYLFAGCTSLETVNAAGVEKIYSYAFYGCTALENIPDLSNVTSMSASAFSGCTSLTAGIDLSSLTSIPASAFYNVPLSSVKLSASLTSIGNYAFYGANFATLSIPDSVTSVGTNAFANNDALTYVKIGSGYTTIYSDAFSGCDNLTAVNFDNYENLVTIPDEWKNSETLIVTYGMVEMDESETGSVGTMTLQEAIDATPTNATEPTTITITEDLYLSSGVTISDGRNVIFTSADGNKIAENPSEKVTNLITVEAGSTLTLAGSLVIDGTGVDLSTISSGLIKVYGTLNLTENASVENAMIEYYVCAAILVYGESATFNMTGGYVQNNTINYSGSMSNCAPVVVMSSSEFNLKAGSIRYNNVIGNPGTNYQYSTGVALSSGSTFNMSGGYITENTGASRGSAVNMISGTTSYFNLSGGEISYNTSKYYSDTTTGAIYAEKTAVIKISGGLITGNSTDEMSGLGGGIALYKVESFTMTGGTITGNTAASSGGGIYIFSENVNISGGTISYNTANQGGGIYIAGTTDYQGDVRIYSAVITENTAGTDSTTRGVGGGVWICPTGDITFNFNRGSAIYNNSASAAADDFAVVDSNDNSHSITLADRALGGESITWHIDGGINDATSSSGTGSVDTSVARYTEVHEHHTHEEIINSGVSLALKAELSDPNATLSNAVATLFITNNTAYSNGGGVASNGALFLGDGIDSSHTLTVKKVWENFPDSEIADEVVFNLYKYISEPVDGEDLPERYLIQEIVLNAENDWTQTIYHINEDEAALFYLEEIVYIDGVATETEFTYEVDDVSTTIHTLTITNTYVPTPTSTPTVSTPTSTPTPETTDEPEETDEPVLTSETEPEETPEPIEEVFYAESDPDVPQTGDISNIALWLALAMISTIGMIITKKKTVK